MENTSVVYSKIGDRLKQFAKDKFHSVAGLCRAIGKEPSHLNGYIAGKTVPGAKLQAQLRAVGCDIEWLMTGHSESSHKAVTNPEHGVFSSVDDLRILKNLLELAARQIDTLEKEMKLRGELPATGSTGLEEHIGRINSQAKERFGVDLDTRKKAKQKK